MGLLGLGGVECLACRGQLLLATAGLRSGRGPSRVELGAQPLVQRVQQRSSLSAHLLRACELISQRLDLFNELRAVGLKFEDIVVLGNRRGRVLIRKSSPSR